MDLRFTSGSQAPAEPRAMGHRSLALKALLDVLRPGTRHAVLDLGAAFGANVEFLARLSCRVRVLDLYAALLAEPLAQREPLRFAGLLERLLPLDAQDSFDALLAWDLFDYLRPDQIAALMRRLAGACRLGAPALAFASNRRFIPATPLRYRIVDREHVAYDGPLTPLRPGPRHPPALLSRALPDYSLHATFLLRNGVQEYVFARGA